MPDILKGRNLKDLDKQGSGVTVSRKNLNQPGFGYVNQGSWDFVRPGNDRFIPGDVVEHERSGRGGGASNEGEGEDDFLVNLDRDEFMNIFFEDLELPDLVRKELAVVLEQTRQNAGFQPTGPSCKLNLVRSYKNSLARRIALSSSLRGELENPETTEERKKEIEEEIAKLPMFEEVDLRYRAVKTVPIPATHATMIALMDNSGSMGQEEKTKARKFFWLLFMFLRRMYDHIDIIFISHTTQAREMPEDEFFDTRESGGTLVSSGLELISSIIKERLKGKTNIYVAQASDGDNYELDNGTCFEIMEDEILPEVQYFAYIQIDNKINQDMGLWDTYSGLAASHKNLQLAMVHFESDIFPVFHELFKKKT